ncbi:hypothetical protein NEDG_01176 [Nematocida displodere]|uniref:Uncharacterized protein n=1 Tax=Nematocida displodere TaxID=1805483 RepID=A0A177EAS7_9MICR|nr:hypothetical protein NEDG_01176 [Nematocida displodere]
MEEAFLESVLVVLNRPFSATMTEETFARVIEQGKRLNEHFPVGCIDEVLGGMHSKFSRGALTVKGAEVKSAHTLSKESVQLLGHALGLPLVLCALAQSMRKGGVVDSRSISFVLGLDVSSYTRALGMAAFYRADILLRGKDSPCYNGLVSLIGHPNSAVKMEAINSLLDSGCGPGLVLRTVEALEKDVQNVVVNPIWAPGMLALVGVYLYRGFSGFSGFSKVRGFSGVRGADSSKVRGADSSGFAGLELDRVLRVVKGYITKSSDERVLNGVQVVCWALTKCGVQRHFPYLAAMALFSKSGSIKKAAMGLLIEYSGHNPNKHSLEIMDAAALPQPPIQKLVGLCRISPKLLQKYSLLLISEGAPSRIKLGVFLWRLTRQPWTCSTEPFNRVASMRMVLAERSGAGTQAPSPGTQARAQALVEQLSVKNISLLVPLDKESLRLALKLCRMLPSSPTTKTLIIFALKKNIFIRSAIKTIHQQKAHPELEKELKTALKSPGVLLAQAFLTAKAKRPILPPPTSPVYLSAQYLIGALCKKDGSVAKKALFASLECYKQDAYLGDVGSFARLDALFLLYLEYAAGKDLLKTLPASVAKTNPYPGIVSKLTKRRLKLLPEERKTLLSLTLKLAIDKSRRISIFIFSSLLPSFLAHRPSRALSLLFRKYVHFLETLPIEDSIVHAVSVLLQRLIKGSNGFLARSICEGAVNSLLSADALLFGKIATTILPLLKTPSTIQHFTNYTSTLASLPQNHPIAERINELARTQE